RPLFLFCAPSPPRPTPLSLPDALPVHFGEADETVNKRLQAVIRHDMTPILCVGETLDEREAGSATDVVVGQLRGALKGIDGDAVGRMAIAYEPVWAIGTGRNATPDDAGEMCEDRKSTR